MRIVKSERYALGCLFVRCQDVPGAWLAECVPLNVVTQGDNLGHAIDMLLDAIKLSLEDDLTRGKSFLCRSPDPEAVRLFNEVSAGVLRLQSFEDAQEDEQAQVGIGTCDVCVDTVGRKSTVSLNFLGSPPVPPARVA
jgi:hypothetical protein